ncbi:MULTISPECIES: ABC transporter permease [Streptomyces]|uniref:Transport permease protein n=1 Tax=Streptomyces morookaense TaxID=1970 RepID=A0A7Y7E6H2_STRMO|nr:MULTISPECIES: ABC transporter permease [Streptomyces]MCC2278147.1 ABC transporter permease [Streptomyces sp. ET3-23]NVK77913.1 ABC transporter permease [Streptomyces morookaense]GHF20840.1 transport permease protein [Streptomyces morookaense]
MNTTRTLATARRVLAQLRHDPRTIAMLLVVPCVLLALLRYMFDQQPQLFDRVGAALLGIFPLLVMFLVTSVAMLRERTTGTLERLLTMPLGRLDLLLGYALAFGAVALVQAVLASALTLGLLGLKVAGPAWLLFAVAVGDGLLGMALGLLVSAFAATEFQAVQFLPAVILPQLLLCGLFVPRANMAAVLRWISDVLPLSYAVDAMSRLTVATGVDALLVRDLAVIAGAALLALALGAATLRRRTA